VFGGLAAKHVECVLVHDWSRHDESPIALDYGIQGSRARRFRSGRTRPCRAAGAAGPGQWVPPALRSATDLATWLRPKAATGTYDVQSSSFCVPFLDRVKGGHLAGGVRVDLAEELLGGLPGPAGGCPRWNVCCQSTSGES
jgi:hypothetical protein